MAIGCSLSLLRGLRGIQTSLHLSIFNDKSSIIRPPTSMDMYVAHISETSTFYPRSSISRQPADGCEYLAETAFSTFNFLPSSAFAGDSIVAAHAFTGQLRSRKTSSFPAALGGVDIFGMVYLEDLQQIKYTSEVKKNT
ncbi:hypothetical protein EV360DRAFT_89428 [Lentinula raphanica]|nr:hypothetical protein EV360DRAFT_89428 [Lentinula raphanica]